MKILVGKNFSPRPEIKSLSADFFFTDKVHGKKYGQMNNVKKKCVD